MKLRRHGPPPKNAVDFHNEMPLDNLYSRVDLTFVSQHEAPPEG